MSESSTVPLLRLVPRRFRRDDSGATAIEFAMVALPFLMMLFGIIGVGLYFFTTFALENAVEQAARQFRTGQAQQAGMTSAQFKTRLCTFLPGNMPCNNKIQINVKSFPDSAAITPASLPRCRNPDGSLNTATEYVPGTANVIVLVWACYEWELGGKLPWITLPGAMSNGSLLIQAATTFRVEPYN